MVDTFSVSDSEIIEEIFTGELRWSKQGILQQKKRKRIYLHDRLSEQKEIWQDVPNITIDEEE